jgi:hypothetical protein
LAGTLLFKIRQIAALLWFGLQNVGILEILYSRAILQRTIVDFPHILETGGKDAMRGDEVFFSLNLVSSLILIYFRFRQVKQNQ